VTAVRPRTTGSRPARAGSRRASAPPHPLRLRLRRLPVQPLAWQCWRINHELGLLNVTKYCTASGHGTSRLVASNAYGWQCTSPAAAVDTTAACNFQYHVSDAVSRFAVFASPDSWQCWD
jgi:hypothetical protein